MKQESKVKFDAIKAIVEKWDASSDSSEIKKIDSLLAMANKWSTSGTGKAAEFKRLNKILTNLDKTLLDLIDEGDSAVTEVLEHKIYDIKEKIATLDYKPVKRQKKAK